METPNPFSTLENEPVNSPLPSTAEATQSSTTAVDKSEEMPPLEPAPTAEKSAKRKRKAEAPNESKTSESKPSPAAPTPKAAKPKSKPKAAKAKGSPKKQADEKNPPKTSPPAKTGDVVVNGDKKTQPEKPLPPPKPSKTDRKLLEPFSPGKEITQHMKDVFKNVMTDLRSTYTTVVDPKDVEWFKKLFGREPVVDATGSMHGINAHGRLAVLRKMALVDEVTYVLSYNPLKTLKERSIDFVYGTQTRDDAVMKTINIALAKAGFGTEQEPCIMHHIIGEQYVPGDVTRRVGGIGVRSKIAVFMDVYALGNYRMHPASIASMGYDLWIWAGHVFNGPFGSYAGALWCREGIDFSQIWYKADATADAYAIHDACDIMHRSGKMTHVDTSVTWTSIAKLYTHENNELVPVYNIILGQNSDKEFLDLHSRNMQPIDVVMLKVKCPIMTTNMGFIDNTVTPWLASVGIYKTRTIPVSSAIYSDLKSVCVARFYNQWTFAAVLTDVNKYFSNLEWFKKLEALLPQKFVNYRYEVASALYTELCEAKKQNLLIMNAVHRNDMSVANDQFKSIGTPEPSSTIPKKALFLGAGLLLGYLAYKKYKNQAVNKIVSKVVQTTNLVGFSYPENPAPLAKQIIGLFEGLKSMTYTPINIPYLTEFVNTNVGKRFEAMPPGTLRRFLVSSYASCLGPILEESAKHLIPSPIIKAIISLIFANLDFREGETLPLGTFVTHFIKHFLFAMLPLDTGIVLHCLSNFVCVAQTIISDPDNVGPLNCIGLNPCLAAMLKKQTCDGRIIATPENFSNLSEFRIISSTNPIYVLTNATLTFIPERESFMMSSNCIAKYPEALDNTIKLRTPNINYDAFKTDTHVTAADCGYYQIFAVSRMQYRPAANGYNSHMMLVNRLLKAPPKSTFMTKFDSRFMIPMAEPSSVYDFNRNLEKLFGNLLDVISGRKSGIVRYRELDLNKKNTVTYNHRRLARDVKIHDVIAHLESDEGFLEWLKHLHGVKQSMYKHYRLTFQGVEIDITSRCVTRIEVSIKSDETLLKFDWVPRPVHRVDPQFACYVGPYIYAASEEAKKVYWFFPIMYDGWLITLTFGSSLNDEGLTAWLCKAQDDSYTFGDYPELLCETIHGMIHIIVAGDDVLMVITQPNTFTARILEADVSQCDHSTRFSQLEFEWAFLSLFGVPDSIISLLRRNSCAELRVRMPHIRDEYIVVDRGYERNTGGTDTTIGNSTCIGHSWVGAIIDQLKETKDQKIYIDSWGEIMLKNYGFQMKIHQHILTSCCYESDTGTFLKGTWWHVLDNDDLGGLRWGPLLSRLIKLSKVMTRPMSICRQNAPKSFPRHSSQATLPELWYCLAQMVKAMERFVWIPPVRTWFESLKIDYGRYALKANLPQYDRVVARSEDVAEFYKVQSSKKFNNIDATMCPCWKERVSKRYKVSFELIDSWSCQLQLVRPGSFSVHPFWEALASVDYC